MEKWSAGVQLYSKKGFPQFKDRVQNSKTMQKPAIMVIMQQQ